MSLILSMAVLILFVVLVGSAYKFIRHGSRLARAVFWFCAAAIAALVAADDRLGITRKDVMVREPPPVKIDDRKLAAAFEDAELELLKFDEIDGVSFVGDEENGKLVIRLFVNDSISEDFAREIQDETVRILIRAMADNCELPVLIGSRSFLSRLRISVVLVRIQALP